MVSIQRVFLFQCLIWIFILLAGVFSCVAGFEGYVSHLQRQTQASVAVYIENSESRLAQQAPLSALKAKEIGQDLVTLFGLKQLILSDTERNSLATISRQESIGGLAGWLVSKRDPRRPQFATSSDNSISVEFIINVDLAATYLNAAFIVLVILATLACLIPLLTILKVRHNFSSELAGAVNQVIVNRINAAPGATPGSLKPEVASALSDSINRINTHFDNKQHELELSAINIKKEAYKDIVTELGNRNMFVEFYERNIENTDHHGFGALALIRATELQTVNQTKGYQQGDEYVKAIANIITHTAEHYKKANVFRLNSSDFVVILPNLSLKDAETFAKVTTGEFNQYQHANEMTSVACMGLVGYENGKPLGELLANVDVAMSIAQSQQANAWHVQHESELDASSSMGSQNWRKIIESILNDKQIELLSQAIQPVGSSTKAYNEIMVRFGANGNALLPTASLMAMADKLGKAIEIDMLIIETALQKISKQNMLDKYFGLNVSATSAHDSQFVIWLERQLLRNSTLASRVVFEITESGLQKNIKASKRFIDVLHRTGARVTVEHFGVGFTSFKFFRELKPDFIKMDTSYTRGLEDDKNNQYFMRLMVDLAHRIGVRVFAEGVESQEEKHIIEQLCLDGAQGYYIAIPQPL